MKLSHERPKILPCAQISNSAYGSCNDYSRRDTAEEQPLIAVNKYNRTWVWK